MERLEREGIKAKYLKYPIYDLEPTGPFLNGVLRNPEGQKCADGELVSEDQLQMWFVLNRYQFEPELRKLLADGYVVVAEDYVGTGMAWGAAKGLKMDWLEELNKFLLKEDLAILFEGQRFMQSQEDVHVHEQDDELMERCRLEHEKLAERHGWTKFKVEGGIEEVAEGLWGMVKEWLDG